MYRGASNSVASSIGTSFAAEMSSRFEAASKNKYYNFGLENSCSYVSPNKDSEDMFSKQVQHNSADILPFISDIRYFRWCYDTIGCWDKNYGWYRADLWHLCYHNKWFDGAISINFA